MSIFWKFAFTFLTKTVSKINVLKGQCHEIFYTFFNQINSTWAPYEHAKTVSRNFSLLQRYSSKPSGVCVVVDYAERWFSNFVIEYLRENKKGLRNYFCLFIRGPRSNLLSKKYGRKSRDTVPFNSQKYSMTLVRKIMRCEFLSNLWWWRRRSCRHPAGTCWLGAPPRAPCPPAAQSPWSPLGPQYLWSPRSPAGESIILPHRDKVWYETIEKTRPIRSCHRVLFLV